MALEELQQPVVYVIDDDASVRRSLINLFESVGIEVITFENTAAFSSTRVDNQPCCLVLDVRLPGLSGMDFQTELARANIKLPIIFMTGHGDIPMSVKAMKAGAVEFLTKPCRDQDLLDAVQAGIAKSRLQNATDEAICALKSSYSVLTSREQQIMILVAAGRMNKQIAGAMGVSEITVKVHRGNVMKKMGAKSLADLVRMTEALGLGPTAS